MRIALLLLLLCLFSCTQAEHKPEPKKSTRTERPDFEHYFTDNQIVGSFLLYDEKHDTYIAVNPERCRQRFTPASTFKIFNSLVGLETGVIPDENYVIKWDSVVRWVPEWNQDNTMQSAMKYSAVPYYQELARRVGYERMKHFIDTAHYGNMDISGGIDKFWLIGGGLRISQEEQIVMLRKLYHYQLPFSRRSIDIVKKITLLEDSTQYKLHGKTGWGEQDGKNIGWLVGYVERGENIYYFATNIEMPEPVDANIREKRKTITRAILQKLGVL